MLAEAWVSISIITYAAFTKESQLSEITVKHPNGGGRVGQFATVSAGVYIRNDSSVNGNCELYGDDVFVQQNSRLNGWCRVSGRSVLSESTLSGFAQVTSSEIHSSRLTGDIWVVDSEVSRSDITVIQGQQVRVVESQLNGVSIFGPVFIQNAKVENCELLPCVRIYGGEWKRSPRIRRSPFQFHCIESHIEGNLLIGCWDRPLDEWKQMVQIYQRIGNKLALASEAIQWDDGEILGGFEKMSTEELNWYANAISSW